MVRCSDLFPALAVLSRKNWLWIVTLTLTASILKKIQKMKLCEAKALPISADFAAANWRKVLPFLFKSALRQKLWCSSRKMANVCPSTAPGITTGLIFTSSIIHYSEVTNVFWKWVWVSLHRNKEILVRHLHAGLQQMQHNDNVVGNCW